MSIIEDMAKGRPIEDYIKQRQMPVLLSHFRHGQADSTKDGLGGVEAEATGSSPTLERRGGAVGSRATLADFASVGEPLGAAAFAGVCRVAAPRS